MIDFIELFDPWPGERDLSRPWAGPIPGAVGHPLSQFGPERIAQGKPVVLICQRAFRNGAVSRGGRQTAG